MNDKENVILLDGMLWGMALLCHGCNFVPIYGAKEIKLENEVNEKNIKSSFLKKNTEITCLKVDDLQSHISLLCNKWIRARLFEGAVKLIPNYEDQYNVFVDELVEMISEVLGVKNVWYVTLEGEDYEIDAEGLIIEGEVNFLIHFSFNT